MLNLSLVDRITIIYIITRTPAYSAYVDYERPSVSWDIGNDWIGIAGTDWANQIGDILLENSSKFNFEVWQPDYKCDKVYSHKFKSGVSHKLFPAIKRIRLNGYKLEKEFTSNILLSELEKLTLEKRKVIVVTSFNYNSFNQQLLIKFNNRIPIIGAYLGNINYSHDIKNNIMTLKKLLKKVIFHKKQIYLNKVKYIFVGDWFPKRAYDVFRSQYPNAKIYKNFLSIPKRYLEVKNYSKIDLRNKYGYEAEEKIFFTSSRITEIKQIDKLILCFPKLKKTYKLLIAGTGEKEYIGYLQSLIDRNDLGENIKMLGYLSEEELIEHYILSDLFVEVSRADGGPISAWKALALGLPVVSTGTGNVGEYLRYHNCGKILPVSNYIYWSNFFKECLENIYITQCELSHVRYILSSEYCGKLYEYNFVGVYNDFYSKEIKK